jgi:hypothetical protein
MRLAYVDNDTSRWETMGEGSVDASISSLRHDKWRTRAMYRLQRPARVPPGLDEITLGGIIH